MKKSTMLSAVIAVVVFLGAFLYASYAKADNIAEPSLDPVRIIQQQKILLVDDVLAETRTFRYAAGAAGSVFGGIAGATAAAASGTAVVPMVVGGAIVYGAAFYGASTLGVEMAYQVTAEDIRKRRDEVVEGAKNKAEEGLNKGKEMYDELEQKFKSWF